MCFQVLVQKDLSVTKSSYPERRAKGSVTKHNTLLLALENTTYTDE